MAYINQEMKKELTPYIKEVLDKYGMKATISIRTSSALRVTLISGPINFIDYINEEIVKDQNKTIRFRDININVYHLKQHFYGIALDFLIELKDAMMKGNHDNSNIMIDYFDVGWYIEINLGTDKKEYILTK